MSRFGIGQPVRRVEDQRFLTGRSRYVDDIALPHMLHGAVVMSPHAHARIRGIDATEALKLPGVVCVLTGQDAKQENLGGIPPLFMRYCRIVFLDRNFLHFSRIQQCIQNPVMISI